MTNTELLKIEMLRKSVSNKDIAVLLNISDNTASRKINGKNEFLGSEIKKISNMLKLIEAERDAIFFK